MSMKTSNFQTPSLPVTLRVISWLSLVLLVAVSTATVAHADQIKLTPRAQVVAGEVKLKDIAELQGEKALALADTVVGTYANGSLSIALADVRKKLDEKGVNWGILSLGGFMKCEISLKQDAVISQPAVPVSGTAMANPSQYVANDTMLTVGDRVTSELVRHSGVSSGDLRITFSPRDQETLAKSILTDRWEVEPLNSAKLGRVLVTVRQWQGDRIVQTYRLSADLSQRTLAVVAKRDVKRGEMFTTSDVEIQEVYLQDDHDQPVSELREVIGKVATQSVDQGKLVNAQQTARPEMIKRGDRLSVRCIVGGMVIRTAAKAMESGAMGDTISVANLDSNERFSVIITGKGEAMLAPATSSMAAPAAKAKESQS